MEHARSFDEKIKIHKCDLRSRSDYKGQCCVCHKTPTHSRTYYGQVFCINCFHKYIWSPAPSKDPSALENINGLATTSKLNVK